MEITNLDSPDDDALEHLARLCEWYGTFLDQPGPDDDSTAAGPAQ